MPRYRISKDAKEDLKELRRYIARDSKQNATKFLQRIRNALRGLERFPEAGAIVPEYNRPDLREVFVGNYRIVYQLIDRVPNVMLIQHGALRLPDSLGRI